MKYNLEEITHIAKNRFNLDTKDIHGIAHWERVRQNGLKIATHAGANKSVVELFAILHDCCRDGSNGDSEHGKRAAEFAKTLQGKFFFIDDHEFSLLYEACEYHAKGQTKADITVMACWDADRLDLWRVGIRPNSKYLCTSYAKKSKIIEHCCSNIEKNSQNIQRTIPS